MRDRRPHRHRLAGPGDAEALEAGPAAILGARHPDEPVAHLRGYEAAPRLGNEEAPLSQRDGVRRENARAGGSAFQQERGPTIERLYRTHWVSRELSETKRERIKAAASRPPELIVIQPLNADWKCHRCGGTGDLLIMEEPGPSCLSCAGLASLQFLPAGDAALSRRAKAKNEVHAVVVRFSRSRKRYERQGLLVQPEALRAAEREIGALTGGRKGKKR